MNHFLLNRRHLLLRQRVAEPARAVGRHRLVERHVVGPGAEHRKELRRKRERARLLGQHVHHRFTNPPDRVRDEFHLARRVEPLCGLDQAEVAFVNQIEEGHAKTAVPLRVTDHEPEVGFHQPRDRRLVPLPLNPRAQLALLVNGQPRQLPDLSQVRSQRTRIVAACRMPPRHAAKHTPSRFRFSLLSCDSPIEPDRSARI